MKNSEKKEVSKFSKNFEIGKSAQLNVTGGTTPEQKTTSYWIDGSQGCSYYCPDSRID